MSATMTAPSAATTKRFDTLRAQAALAGVTLYQTDGDHGYPVYVATRWALTKQFESLDELTAWLARVTGLGGTEGGRGAPGTAR